MENISEMVNEHPFEVDLHVLNIKYVRSSLSVREIHDVRLECISFVDPQDDFWVDWISDSQDLPVEAIAQILSAVIDHHPSPRALAQALALLPKLVVHGWNGWEVFPPRPTAAKSAVRYIETAIEKVGLWCDSSDFWDAVRHVYGRLEPSNPDAIRRIFVRQIKAVPMSSDARNLLINQLHEFESTHSLSQTTSIESLGERLWNSWSSMEIRSRTDSSIFPEMIQKRKSTDPPEYIRSLYARSVFAEPTKVDYWLEYSRNVDSSDRVSILKRAVRNNPYSGVLWLELVKATNDSAVLDHAIMMGSSALRDSPNKDPDSLHVLLVAEIALTRERGTDRDQLRAAYQSALSIMQEMNSPKHVAAVFVSWMYYESNSEPEFVAGVMGQFISANDWETVRAAVTPLQWVQLALIFQKCSDDVEETRKLYSVALALVPEKYRYMILTDQALFEESFGDLAVVIGIRQQLLEIQKQAERVPLKKEGKKRMREGEDTERSQIEREPSKPRAPEAVHQTRFVFMRDIPFNVAEDTLGEFLDKTCGAGTPKQVIIVRDDQGKSRGFGYAEFDSVEQANRAIAKTGTKLKSRNVVIQPSDREITSKRDRAPVQALSEQKDETQSGDLAKRDNDYFRNLIARKQKHNS